MMTLDERTQWQSRCTLAHSNEPKQSREAIDTLSEVVSSRERTDFPVVIDAHIAKHCYYTRQGFLVERNLGTYCKILTYKFDTVKF